MAVDLNYSLLPTWYAMIQRCTNPNNLSYKNYGGRGIKVCDRWLNSYDDFVADVGEKPTPQHSLDRTNNNLGYSPDNCRWATKREQAHNRRPSRYKGEKNIPRYESGIVRKKKKWIVLGFYKTDTIGEYNTKPEAIKARKQFIITLLG